ncbi:MAG TPA: hypothetical protein VEU62_03580 [Bryobacterales bacterium]|nr:hypothetical protein [Bryobacterales bacterium]
MDRLEQELSGSLRRKSPSPDFTAKVMARVRAERRPRTSLIWRWALAGALAASLLAGVYIRHEAAERARAESAKRQLILSLQIASAKVNKAREAVIRSTREDSL